MEAVEFWRRRIFESIATGKMLHQIIYDDSYDLWKYIQGETGGDLKRLILPGSRVLDAGCGYGALLCCFQEAKLKVDYTGVDISPDLLELARYRYPDRQFVLADLRSLPFKSRSFNWAVLRSIKDMIVDNVGESDWQLMDREIRRVARSVLYLEYSSKVDENMGIRVEKGDKHSYLLHRAARQR